MMAIDLQLDSSNQLIFKDNGDLQLFDGIEELAQNIETQLTTHQGTHVVDEDYGFPFLDLVFVKNPNTTLISAVAKTLLLDRFDVLSVSNVFSVIDNATRTHTLNFDAETTEGQLNARGLGI